MAEQKQQKDDKDKSILIALLFFLGAGSLIWMSLGSNSAKKSGPNPLTKSAAYEKNVNHHLMMTNENIEMAQKRAAIENANLNNGLSGTKPQAAYSNPEDLDLSTESHATDLANELGRGERKEDQLTNPADIVQKDLFNAQQEKAYSEAYKQEYARQFIENARKGGYNVILTDDYRVKSVSPIRQPSLQGGSIFGSEGAGAQ